MALHGSSRLHSLGSAGPWQVLETAVPIGVGPLQGRRGTALWKEQGPGCEDPLSLLSSWLLFQHWVLFLCALKFFFIVVKVI